jgi:tRNA threonylcarbamoyladenosine biosynthesis protein TsaB
MRVLSLETSGTTGSVAVLEDNELVAEQALPGGQRSAQSLVPTIQALLAQAGWKISQVGLLMVTSGPGSFTSLRIGVSTAKALAYAVGAEILGVNTLEVIARQAHGDGQPVKVVLDAQRDQLFAATLASGKAGREPGTSATAVVDNQDWLDSLQPGEVVSGPGLKRLADRLPPGVIVVDRALWMPTATVVGQIGFEQYSAGRRDDVFQLVPQYFRRTAAEEQWDRRQGPAG